MILSDEKVLGSVSPFSSFFHRLIHFNMPGMCAQVPWESIEKQWKRFTVTNASMLFRVESKRMAVGVISVQWKCWWAKEDFYQRQWIYLGREREMKLLHYTKCLVLLKLSCFDFERAVLHEYVNMSPSVPHPLQDVSAET